MKTTRIEVRRRNEQPVADRKRNHKYDDYKHYIKVHVQWDVNGRAVWDVGLRPLASWNCGFESRRRHGSLSLVSIVYCQVQVSVMGRSFVQSSPTKCRVSECDIATLTWRRPWPTTAVEPRKKQGTCMHARNILHSVKTERQKWKEHKRKSPASGCTPWRLTL